MSVAKWGIHVSDRSLNPEICMEKFIHIKHNYTNARFIIFITYIKGPDVRYLLLRSFSSKRD